MTFLHLDSRKCGLIISVFIVIRPSLYTLIVVSSIVVGGSSTVFQNLFSNLLLSLIFYFVLKFSTLPPTMNQILESNAEPNIESYAWDLNIGSKPRI